MKFFFSFVFTALSFVTVLAQDVVTKQPDGTSIVNTTTLAQEVKGYKATTPVNIFIKSGKVVKVEALENKEGPKYMNMVRKGIIDKWNGLKVSKAVKLKVDAVSGATYTSNAIIENVVRGLKFYQKNNK